ncbi:MAG: YraN family protein [Nitrospinales bacterium]
MTQARSQFGKKGEEAAAAFLRKKGYRILKMNFRSKAGEIDIIAEHKKTVVFVEVKARASWEFGPPLSALTPCKQKKLVRLAECFLARYKAGGRERRFDVVSISGEPDRPQSWKIELLQDAFRA